MKRQPRRFVSCNGCGAMYARDVATGYRECPTCEYRPRGRTDVPKVGRVTKWWTEVDL